ncbi:HelD family protein [Camelliibacillus cellulosilyticus]|uniref:HelD family protein n=1 Tax=Camelliibacillus cellulosilyticus TaxID=2174486 RepID=A0ABV9GFT7_9BACL
MDKHPFDEEQKRLTQTLSIIDKQKAALDAIRQYTGSDITEIALDDMREKERMKLRIAGKEPYFARLDFQEDGKETANALYIGKAGCDNGEGEPLVIDWRAPIASLFYSFTGGDTLAEYVAPEGIIEGHVHLKRNIVVRNRTLERVVDAYVKGTNDLSNIDEFLLYRLSERGSDKLRDIVSTIQSEQNDIIRSPKNVAMIIQGVAGSGKTTIALHRLAYLIYEHQDSLRPERMIIFAPNRLFLDYIAGVLPELGVGGIKQTTFNDWALERIDESVTFEEPELRDEINRRDKLDDRFKESLAFLHVIDQTIKDLEASAVPDVPLTLWDGAELPPATIRQWFDQDYRSYPLMKRRERVETRIKQWMDSALKTIESETEKKTLKRRAGQKIRTYMKTWLNDSPLSFYMKLIKEHPDIPIVVRRDTLQMLKQKKIGPDDLAPLVAIRNRFYGLEKGEKFHHVVIDEAQDFSPFQVALLNEMTIGQSFSILGDLSQGIHEGGIDSWKAFTDVFNEDKIRYFQLVKSYRSTVEIIEFANQILLSGFEPLCLAEPIFRSGKDVQIIGCSESSRKEKIVQNLKSVIEGGRRNIGLITRTVSTCKSFYQTLIDADIQATLLSERQDRYEGGISVMPVYLSKGMEFDAVIIVDADQSSYPLDPEHAKLLYVACTRALHELWVFHNDTPSPLLPI